MFGNVYDANSVLFRVTVWLWCEGECEILSQYKDVVGLKIK